MSVLRLILPGIIQLEIPWYKLRFSERIAANIVFHFTSTMNLSRMDIKITLLIFFYSSTIQFRTKSSFISSVQSLAIFSVSREVDSRPLLSRTVLKSSDLFHARSIILRSQLWFLHF